MQVNQPILIFVAVVVLVVGGILVVAMMIFMRLWIRAFLSGAQISMLNLIAMRFRGSDMNSVVNQCIAASQAGHPVSCQYMEWAWLQKVDIEKVTLAYVTARKRDLNFSFQELVDAELEGRIEAMLRQCNQVSQ